MLRWFKNKNQFQAQMKYYIKVDWFQQVLRVSGL